MKSAPNNIIALRNLLSTVVSNTKKEINGKKANPEREEKELANVLKVMFGRDPEPAELAEAQQY